MASVAPATVDHISRCRTTESIADDTAHETVPNSKFTPGVALPSAPCTLLSGTLPLVQSADWVLDPGAPHHFYNDLSRGMAVFHVGYSQKGRTSLHVTKKGELKTVVLHNVQYAPAMMHNPPSPHALALCEDLPLSSHKTSWSVKARDGHYALTRVSPHTNLAMIQGKIKVVSAATSHLALGGQGPLRFAHFARSSLLSIADRTSHIRLTHASIPNVEATMRPEISTGPDDKHNCHCCGTTISKTPKVIKGNSKALRPVDVITCDTCFNDNVKSSIGFGCAVLVKGEYTKLDVITCDTFFNDNVKSSMRLGCAEIVEEDYTKFMAVHLIKDKTQASQCVISLLQWSSTQLSFRNVGRPHRIHLDQGTEYTGLCKYAKAEGIDVETTHTNDHTVNGSVESSIAKVHNTTRKLLADANLPFQLWDFALLHAVSVHNILYHQHINTSPFVLFHRKVPNLSRLRAFGSVCYVVHPDVQRDLKVQETALMGIYLGHVQYGKHYLVWDPRSGRICQSPFVRFLEHRRLPDYMKRHPELDKPRMVQKPKTENPSSLHTSGEIAPARTVNDTYTSNDFGHHDLTEEGKFATKPPFPTSSKPRTSPGDDGAMDIPDYEFKLAGGLYSGGDGRLSPEDLENTSIPSVVATDGAVPATDDLPADVQTNVRFGFDPDAPVQVDTPSLGSMPEDSNGARPASEVSDSTTSSASAASPDHINVPTAVLPCNIFSTDLAPPGCGSRPFAEDTDGSNDNSGCYADLPDHDMDAEFLPEGVTSQIILPAVEEPAPLARTAPLPIERVTQGIGRPSDTQPKRRSRTLGSKNKKKVAKPLLPPDIRRLARNMARDARQASRHTPAYSSTSSAQPSADGDTSPVQVGQGDSVAADTGLDTTDAGEPTAHLPSGSGSQGEHSFATDATTGEGETSGDTPADTHEHRSNKDYVPTPSEPQLLKAAVQNQSQGADLLGYYRILQEAVPLAEAWRVDDQGNKESVSNDSGFVRKLWEQEAFNQELFRLHKCKSADKFRKRMRSHLAAKVAKEERGTVLVDYHGETDGANNDYFASYLVATVMKDGKEYLPSGLLPSTHGLSALTVSFTSSQLLSSKRKIDHQSSDPERYKHATALPDQDSWKQATKEETASIEDNTVFEWKDVADVTGKTLPSRWVFNRNFNLDDLLDCYKARVVAKGFMREPGVDYLTLFSPVIKFESVRFLLAFATFKKWNIHKTDVKTAFLYDGIYKTTFTKPSDGYAHPADSTKAWKLKEYLYGLVQAPKCWNQKLQEVMTNFGLTRHQSEHGLHSNRTRRLSVGVYVHDLLITGANTTEVTKFKKYLTDNFEMKDLGPVSKFLDIQVSENNQDAYSLDMEGYLTQMSKDLDIPVHHKVLVPLDQKDLEKFKGDSPLTDATVYRQGIGKLSYLAHTVRVNIAHAVNFLATFNQALCVSHQTLLHKLLRYVCETTATRPMRVCWLPSVENQYVGDQANKSRSLCQTAGAEYTALSEVTVSFVDTANQLANSLAKRLVWTTLNPALQKIGIKRKDWT